MSVQMSEFGSYFRKARESQGMSLDTIAAETRISTRFLQAIENGEFHLLPGGVFNRGFIRAYAEAVGLNPENAVAEYQRLTQPSETDTALRMPEPVAGRPSRHLLPVTALALLIAIAIFYIAGRTPESGPPVAEAPAEAPTEIPGLQTPPTASDPPLPAASPAPEMSEPGPEPSRNTAPAIAAAAAPLTVEMEVHELTWVRVLADGRPLVAGELLQPGTVHTYSAQTSIDLTIGNAGGLTVKVNGRELGALGPSGTVRFLTLTPESPADLPG